MNTLIKYMILPREVTTFEHNYLSKLNRITLYFFFAHIPIFMLVAWAAGTGPLFALVLTLGLLIGPTVAQVSLKSERTKSLVYGFTAMCMGGLLVHFGQGPMQIEMHFYFFALLAMLCMYANPTVNLVAAVTVALHHLIMWLVLPRSVFNYDASIWVVGVHALFVVLETVAACYISRSFFDNVIGLEKKVQERTKAVQMILDNIGEGFMTVDMNGIMSEERSSVVATWFGESNGKAAFPDYIRPTDGAAAEWFELGMDGLRDGFLPAEVSISQLPRLMSANASTYELKYKPIYNAADHSAIDKLLVIISDVTSRIERERAEQDQKQLMQVFEHIMRDKLGFLQFLPEADGMIDSVVNRKYDDVAHLKRIVHTVKGNAGLFGMTKIAESCHQLEDEIAAENAVPDQQKFTALHDDWTAVREKLNGFLGDRAQDNIEISEADYDGLLGSLETAGSSNIVRMVKAWKLESADRRLQLVKQQTESIAQRLGKKGVKVQVMPGEGVRFEGESWAPFWSSFVHVLRNAVDHGIESTEDRIAAGKPADGAVTIRTFIDRGELVIAVEDDGRGIDWQAIADKATKAGLPHATQTDLVNALYQDGITTKQALTLYSGRGIGMGAVRMECEKRHGKMEVQSQAGQGAKFLFRFPLNDSIYCAQVA